jgi:hypothetical protein
MYHFIFVRNNLYFFLKNMNCCVISKKVIFFLQKNITFLETVFISELKLRYKNDVNSLAKPRGFCPAVNTYIRATLLYIVELCSTSYKSNDIFSLPHSHGEKNVIWFIIDPNQELCSLFGLRDGTSWGRGACPPPPSL